MINTGPYNRNFNYPYPEKQSPLGYKTTEKHGYRKYSDTRLTQVNVKYSHNKLNR